MKVFLFVISGFLNIFAVSCKSILDTNGLRNNISAESQNEVNGDNKWMPMKSYVNQLAQLPPRQDYVQQHDGSSSIDPFKTSESSLQGISVLRDGSHPLDYLHNLYQLQQQHANMIHVPQQQQMNFTRSVDSVFNPLVPVQPCNKNKQDTESQMRQHISAPELVSASTNHMNTSAELSQQGDDDDDDSEGVDDEDIVTNSGGAKGDTLNIDESMPLETYSKPLLDSYPAIDPTSDSDSDYPAGQDTPDAAQGPISEAAERSEAEAAEAREAEAADRSALDEQQQQQREIIKAQARSEAIAIKEQQEALLRQQTLQQQMLLRRQQSDLRHQQQYEANEMLPVSRRLSASPTSGYKQRQQMSEQPYYNRKQLDSYNRFDPVSNSKISHKDVDYSVDQSNGYKVADNPVSNHRDSQSKSNSDQEAYDGELGVDYSIRQPQISVAPDMSVNLLPSTRHQMNLTDFGDLLPAAQGSYGSLHGHHGHGDYYMFAHSHKKGSFDSGFKRGSKKSTISGHASQHKSHADGHMKWHGKKGKGSHYWDLNHSNKKHYGGGHHYYRR